MAPQPRLEGKVAIVTGGASGFGKGIAAKYVQEGARVVIADLSEEAGQAVAQELGCHFVTGDVTKREDWESLLKAALHTFGQLDIVVNNAGATYANKPTDEVTEKDFDLVMNVNVKSIYFSTNVLLPYFLEKKRPGCFIQVASTAGVRPRPRLTWYNASKATVINATKVGEQMNDYKIMNTDCDPMTDDGSRIWTPADSLQCGLASNREHGHDTPIHRHV